MPGSGAMDGERWRSIEALFQRALDVAPAERERFLAEQCSDAELRREVAELLASDAREDAFLRTDSRLQAPAPALEAGAPDLGATLGAWRLVEPLGRGGMGVVFKVVRADGQYRQAAALKRVRVDIGREAAERFLVERQILARLNHTGIARLLDGGVTPDGTSFLVMELVDGEPIDAHLDARRAPIAERVDVFLRVCEAIAYAHRNLVVHRDLKPSNVLVTRDGAVKVVDFGIAKVLEDDTPGLTRTGQRLLTPEYASPEQIRGEPVTTASDVYSLGVLLHVILTGAHPHGEFEKDRFALEQAICERPPTRPSTSARGALPAAAARGLRPVALQRELAGDLDNIVLMALRKEPERRYASVDALAADLRRYRAGMPVEARGDDLAYRARRFAGRHRVGVAVGFALLAAAVAFAAREWRSAARDRTRLEEILRLKDTRNVAKLREEIHLLWPSYAPAIQGLESWLAKARALLDRRALYEADLARVRAAGRDAGGGRYEFDDDELAWRHENLTRLLADLGQLANPDAEVPITVASAERRLEFARSVEAETLAGAAAEWDAAIRSIADAAECPAYHGLEVEPQLGLVPLRRDSASGLWEFWHTLSGSRPEAGEDGRWRMERETGVVLVLVPGGSGRLGAQRGEPEAPHFDPEAAADEGPVREVEIAPFFISKYELTQAQFRRAAGANPSFLAAEVDVDGGRPITWSHPVERFSWRQGQMVLARVDLRYPTAEQWEYAARGGSGLPYLGSAEPAALERILNCADRTLATERGAEAAALDLSDGYSAHAPVGSFAPNGFGLHDVLGNVAEWCIRAEVPYFKSGAADQQDVDLGPEDDWPRCRGGSYFALPRECRVTAVREVLSPFSQEAHVGARPIRPLRSSR